MRVVCDYRRFQWLTMADDPMRVRYTGFDEITVNLPALAESIADGEIGSIEVGTLSDGLMHTAYTHIHTSALYTRVLYHAHDVGH